MTKLENVEIVIIVTSVSIANTMVLDGDPLVSFRALIALLALETKKKCRVNLQVCADIRR